MQRNLQQCGVRAWQPCPLLCSLNFNSKQHQTFQKSIIISGNYLPMSPILTCPPILCTLSHLKPCFSRVLLLWNAVQSCLVIALWRTAKQIFAKRQKTLPCNLEILDIVSFCIVLICWLVVVNIWHDIFSATSLPRELKLKDWII